MAAITIKCDGQEAGYVLIFVFFTNFLLSEHDDFGHETIYDSTFQGLSTMASSRYYHHLKPFSQTPRHSL